jgi:hypothetical protein
MLYRSISYDVGFENASGSIISQKFISTLHGRSNALTHARLDEPGEASRPSLCPESGSTRNLVPTFLKYNCPLANKVLQIARSPTDLRAVLIES